MQLRNGTLLRTARRLLLIAVVLVIAEIWIALASGGSGGGMVGGREGLLGGVVGLLWVGLLLAVSGILVYVLGWRGDRSAPVRRGLRPGRAVG